MLVVSDTSVLSALAQLKLLHLLHELFDEITLTHCINDECLREGAPKQLIEFLKSTPPWILVVPDPPVTDSRLIKLDPGKASALSLALLHRDDVLVIMDEQRGRKAAVDLDLVVTGLIGILVVGANEGLINFESTIKQLRETNFWIADSVIDSGRKLLRS